MVCGGNADADEAIMKIVKIDHILAAAGKLGGAGGSVGRTAKIKFELLAKLPASLAVACLFIRLGHYSKNEDVCNDNQK